MNKLIFSSSAIGVLYSVMNMLLIPNLSVELNSAYKASSVMSAAMIASLIITPVIGYICDKYHQSKRIIELMFCIGAISLTCIYFFSGEIAAFFGFLIVFVSFSILTPFSAIAGIVSKDTEKDRNFGMIMGMVNFTVFIASFFIGSFNENKVMYLFFSLYVLFMVIPILKIKLNFKKSNDKHLYEDKEKRNFYHYVKNIEKPLIIFFLIQFSMWFVIGGIMPFLTSFLSTNLSMSIGEAAFWLGLSTLISSISSFSSGKICKYIRQKKLFMISISVLTFLIIIFNCCYELILNSNIFIGIFFLLASSIFLGFFYSLGGSIISVLSNKKDQGKAFGINSFFMILGQAISVALSGFVIEKQGYSNYWILMLVLTCIAFVLSIFFVTLKNTKEVNYAKSNV